MHHIPCGKAAGNGRLLCVLLASIALCGGITAKDLPESTAVSERLQAVLDRAVKSDGKVPGILASVSAPSIHLEWSGASGRIRLDDPETLQPDQPFRIASITKIFVAAAIFKLCEQHRLALFGPIAPYLSSRTDNALRRHGYRPDVITIQQLLAHTSGIYDHASDPAYSAALIASPHKHWTPAEQIQFAMEHGKPVGRPGQRFVYSDTGYVILGEIIEGRMHQPLPACIRKLLGLDALELRSTYFESLETPPSTKLVLAHQYFGAADFADVDPSFDLYGGGGIVSTTADLNRFLRALLTGRLFSSPQTLSSALMTIDAEHEAADHLHANLLTTYPFGRRICWGHRGVWASEALYCPDIDLAVSVTLNQSEALDGPELKSLVASMAEELERVPGF